MSNQFFPLISGPRPMPADEKRRYQATVRALDQLSYGLSRVGVSRPDADALPLAGEWYERCAEAEAQCKEMQARVGAALAEFRKAHGEGDRINDPAEILTHLPRHRVTSGPSCTYGRVTYDVALPPREWPALAKLAGLSEYEARKQTEPESGSAAAQELRQLDAALDPLRWRGFDAALWVNRVTKSNVLVHVTVSSPSR